MALYFTFVGVVRVGFGVFLAVAYVSEVWGFAFEGHYLPSVDSKHAKHGSESASRSSHH